MSWLTNESLLEAARGTAGAAVNWWIQSALLIAAGLAVGALSRKRGSAVQSAVYRTTLAAAVAAPLVTWGLNWAGVQGWSVEMPEAWSRVEVEPSAIVDAAETESGPNWAAIGDNALTSMQSPNEQPAPPPGFVATRISGVDPSAAVEQATSSQSPALASSPLPAPAPPVQVPIDAASVFAIHRFGVIAAVVSVAWAVVVAVMVTRLAMAWRRLGRIRRRAAPADLSVQNACRELAARLGVTPPAVLHSPYLPSPCLTGLRRPAVLLPEAPGDLPMRDVLAHELAHLSRGDCYWNLLRQLAGAALFFQPLMWRLSRRLEATAEEVCDDYVVHLGGDRRGYAHRLVDIAELSLAPFAPAGVGMVSLRSMLGQRMARILDTSRSLSTRVGGALLAVVLVGGLLGTLAAGLVGLSESASAVTSEKDAAADTDESSDADKSEADDDVVIVRGQVVDPEGKPMPGVDVCALRWYWNSGDRKPLATTKADANGRFEISYRKSQFAETAGRPNQWREVYIAGFAKGFGPGWAHYDRLKPGEEATVKLAVDDVPIEGRVIDLEGNPIAGATIEVGSIAEPNAETLDEYVAAISAGQAISTAYSTMDETLPHHSAGHWSNVTTDAEGRFRLTGIGRERLFDLHVSGPTIVTKTIRTATRRMEPIVHPAYAYEDADDTTQYGAEFEYAAAPSRSIEGVVRDADTGEPVAGAEVWSWKFAGEDISGITTIKTKADAQGRFRLEGMPKGDGNRIIVVPTDLPYFTRDFDVPDPPGAEPAPLDLDLHRGVWVVGRVTDKTTGEPITAHMHYLAFPDNKQASELEEFKFGSHHMTVQDRFRTDAEGNYRVVALPGRGVVAAKAVLRPYPGGQGYEDIEGVEDRESWTKLNGVFAPTEKFPTALKEFFAEESAAETVCNLELDPGGQVTVRTIDPAGAPLSGVRVTGISEIDGNMEPMAAAEFDLMCFRPGESRTVLLEHPERRLGMALRVKAEDGRDGPITVALAPMATVTGRLVQDEQPISGASVRIDVAGDNNFGRELRSTATDAEGRFRHEAFLPGLAYDIHIEGAGIEIGTICKELDVKAGETVDLGMIDIAGEERPEPMRSGGVDEPAKAAAAESADKEKRVVGRVVGPDGEPVAGATVMAVWVVPSREPPTERHEHMVVANVASDSEGQFVLDFSAEPPTERRPTYGWHVVAFKPGLGPAWRHSVHMEKDPSPTLQLARDIPVRGRVLDLEGRPVSGVTVRIRDLQSTQSEEDIANWIKESKEKPIPDAMEDMFFNSGDERYAGRFPVSDNDSRLASGSPALPPDVRTNEDGQFSFAGLGRNRLALVEFAGPTITKAVVPVVTRTMKTLEARPLHTTPVRTGTFYGQEFDYVAGPTQPVIGTVTDAESGKPIANMDVRVGQFAGDRMGLSDFMATRTDADGKYRLVGAPAGGGHRIDVEPGVDEPYFSQYEELPAVAAGGDEIVCDLSLRRGRWIVGRVTDGDKGAPIENASVEYLPLRSNKHATDYAYFRPEITGSAPTDRFKTGADGRFRVLAIPGPGILTAISPSDRREEFCALGLGGPPKHLVNDDGYTQTYLPWTATNMHALREFDVDGGAAESTCDLAFTRGLKRVVKLVDAAGEPAPGVQVLGRVSPPSLEEPLKESTLTIVGLRPGSERDVVFIHPERRIGKALNLAAGDETTIKLEPCAVARGRVVDEDGLPIEGLSVHVSIDHPDNWGRMLLKSNTDADGRFEALLPPGTVCRVSHYTMSGPNFFAQCEPQPGAVFELGDLADDVELTTEQTVKMIVAATAPIPPAAQEAATATAGEAKTPAEAQLAETPGSGSVVRGRVVGADGKPVAGADVAVTAMRIKPQLGGDLSPNGDVLAEAKTDADGALEMSLVGASSKTHQYSMLIARTAGAAIGWQKLDLDAPTTDAVIELQPEAPVVLRLVDIEGQPAAGTRVTVTMIMQRSLLAGLFGSDGAGFRGERLPAAWIPPLVADAEGRIEIPHVAENFSVSLQVSGDERFAPQEIAVNTGMEEQRGERDATYRSLVVNNVGSDGATSVPLAPAQLFTGTVTYEDTGEPAPHARLTIWASQQEMGSMMSVAGVADEKGRFRISPNPGIRFGVNAYPQEGAPYLVRSVEPIAWRGGDKSREVNVKLPRGVLVRGQVLERGTNKPVAGASVQYVPEQANNPHAKDDIVTGWQGMLATDDAGNFQMAVLPGPGRILVHGPDGEHVLHETSGQELFRGTAGGRRNYASAIERIDPAPDAEPLELTIFIERGQTVRGELVDATGAPVNQAVMVTRLTIRPFWLSWHGQPVDVTGGPFEVAGLIHGTDVPVHFLDPRRKLGATLLARAGMAPQRVVMQPCGKAVMRFVDDDGKPVDSYEPNFQFVVTPGVHEYSKMARDEGMLAADADFLANVDRLNHGGYRKTGADGKFEIAALIPGAAYRIVGYRDGEFSVAKDFVAEAGKTLDLGDVVVQPQER